jgi:predicted nucleic acid-binding protein
VHAVAEPGDSRASDWFAAVWSGRVSAHVPDLVYAEVASSFLKYVRAGRMTAEQADERLAYLLDAPFEPVAAWLLARQALALALIRGLSAYDACYLALALGYDAVLVTADRRLAGKAEQSALLPEEGPPDDELSAT